LVSEAGRTTIALSPKLIFDDVSPLEVSQLPIASKSSTSRSRVSPSGVTLTV